MSLPGAEPIVVGRDLADGFEHTCDAVIVGSGAGGSVTAALLAEAGLDVVVLEEGPYYPPSEYQTFTPGESLRRLFRQAGMLTALGIGQTPLISLLAGRAVGGSSLLTGAVCFRVPDEVHAHWAGDLGLTEWSARALEDAYEEVERTVRVEEVPASMRSASTNKFVEGAARLGVAMKPTRRNTGHECEGNARCNFTCPVGAKRSVDVSYLPRALERGARVVADALVSDILVDGGRAVGVAGTLLGEGPRRRFEVRAPIVVSACGTLHTPLLLQRAGVGQRTGFVGERITLHPAARVVGLFDDRIDGWNGALQSVYCDHWDSEGIKLVGVYTAVNVLAAGFPGVGPALRKRARMLPHCAAFGGMVHDEGGGRVQRAIGREPLLSYEMAGRDLARLKKTIRILSELALAAGAREVFTPIFGWKPVTSEAEARRIESEPFDARRMECLAFHPLGSARASSDPRRGVVDSSGAAWDLPGLYVADGSILPTSIGVNSQIAIMTLATHVARRITERAAKARKPSGGRAHHADD